MSLMLRTIAFYSTILISISNVFAEKPIRLFFWQVKWDVSKDSSLASAIESKFGPIFWGVCFKNAPGTIRPNH